MGMKDTVVATPELIQAKVEALFADRKLDMLLYVPDQGIDPVWLRSLYRVQHSIYRLDAYLESRWKLDKTNLGELWGGIYASLASIQVPEKRWEKMTREIRAYQKIETRCRRDRWPSGVSFFTFYGIKSCDVRLVRQLIYRQYPTLDLIWKEKNWLRYDMITEVIDDLADLREDLQTFNANRFLISALRKGWPKTWHQYREHICAIENSTQAWMRKKIITKPRRR